jgi:hypothetical protein
MQIKSKCNQEKNQSNTAAKLCGGVEPGTACSLLGLASFPDRAQMGKQETPPLWSAEGGITRHWDVSQTESVDTIFRILQATQTSHDWHLALVNLTCDTKCWLPAALRWPPLWNSVCGLVHLPQVGSGSLYHTVSRGSTHHTAGRGSFTTLQL